MTVATILVDGLEVPHDRALTMYVEAEIVDVTRRDDTSPRMVKTGRLRLVTGRNPGPWVKKPYWTIEP